MNSIRLTLACVASLLALIAPLAHAAGWGAILRDGPLEKFNDEDIRLHMETALKVLNSPLSTSPVEWRNDATGAGASFKVLGEPKVKGYAECRRVSATTYAKARKASRSAWTACKDTGGRWLVVKVG